MLKRVLRDIASALTGRAAPTTDHAADMLARGCAALLAGDPDSAFALAGSILSIHPADEAALELLLASADARRQYADSIELLRRAADAGAPGGYRMLGTAYRKCGQTQAALASLEQATRIAPDDHRAWNELGILNLERGNASEARAHFMRALALAPDLAEAHCNLGIIALDALDIDAGIASLRRALALNPALIEARCTLGFALFSAGEMVEAEQTFADALVRAPDHPLARTYYAFFLLGRGEWKQGWTYFEDRLNVSPPPIAFRHRQWHGEPLSGQRVLVRGEQGLGDQIMFASCLPDLIAQGCACSLSLDRRLNGLMARAFPEAAIVDDRDDRRYDYEIAIGSLPHRFRSAASAFPQRTAYLHANPARIDAWKDRLRSLGAGLKIGISWRGGTLGTRRAFRSLPLADLARALQMPGVRLVSLQYGDCADEIASVAAQYSIALAHWPEAIEDYDETAALVCALDLVVSVCTSVVHLAGALGRRTWVLAPANAEWRYGFSGTTMPWYSSVEIRRQQAANDWTAVLDEIRMKLTGLIASNNEDEQ
jgi:tetratricopeptide (TPR) repeat protein